MYSVYSRPRPVDVVNRRSSRPRLLPLLSVATVARGHPGFCVSVAHLRVIHLPNCTFQPQHNGPCVRFNITIHLLQFEIRRHILRYNKDETIRLRFVRAEICEIYRFFFIVTIEPFLNAQETRDSNRVITIDRQLKTGEASVRVIDERIDGRKLEADSTRCSGFLSLTASSMYWMTLGSFKVRRGIGPV